MGTSGNPRSLENAYEEDSAKAYRPDYNTPFLSSQDAFERLAAFHIIPESYYDGDTAKKEQQATASLRKLAARMKQDVSSMKKKLDIQVRAAEEDDYPSEFEILLWKLAKQSKDKGKKGKSSPSGQEVSNDKPTKPNNDTHNGEEESAMAEDTPTNLDSNRGKESEGATIPSQKKLKVEGGWAQVGVGQEERAESSHARSEFVPVRVKEEKSEQNSPNVKEEKVV